MKKTLLLCAFLVANFSVSARRYTQNYGSCTFRATVEDMFNGSTELPFTFDVEYILSFDQDSGEYVGQRTLLVPQVSATSGVSFQDIQDISEGITFDESGDVNIELGPNLVAEVIAYAGDYRARYNSHKLPSVSGVFTSNEEFCLQSHLEPSVDSGLSYHVCGECVINDNPAQRPGQRPVPRQRL